MAPPNADELVSQFVSLTEASPELATNYLGAANWNLDTAVQEYFTAQEEEDQGEGEDEDGNESEVPAVPGGGRTLGGEGVPSRNVPAASSSSSSSRPAAGATAGAPGSSAQQRKKFGSLRDFAGSGSSGAPQASSDDEDDDPDLYAGGEKSGLAVQNPQSTDELRRKILEKAKKRAAQGGLPADEPEQRSHFSGRAQTLGGDDTPSRVIEDPEAGTPRPLPRVQRTLHFWENGFSVDDGPLFHKDDPANQARLEMIQRGRAPYDILNVEHNQEADVKLEQHETPYVQPKKKYVPFSGQGQRLGSPTPGLSGVAPPPPQPATAAPASASTTATTASRDAGVTLDSSQPTVRMQIRLADGTRLVSSFNTTHTVGDIYGFVSASHPASQSRPWTLATTFPNKELSDRNQVIGESTELRKGGTIVQKWA